MHIGTDFHSNASSICSLCKGPFPVIITKALLQSISILSQKRLGNAGMTDIAGRCILGVCSSENMPDLYLLNVYKCDG